MIKEEAETQPPIISWQQIKLGKSIGNGVFSKVYRGEYEDKDVAIKKHFICPSLEIQNTKC